ncbi:MAG: SGNH/GDSL hydrolase family protein [Patescibacteria group bacterium]
MRKVILILLGLAVGLAVSEIGLRMWDHLEQSREQAVNFYDCADKLYAHDSTIGWRLVPNESCRQKTVEYDVEYKTNGKGFRDDEEHSYAKDPAKKRIVILGDSHTFGQGIAIENTFGKLLQKNTGAEVLNFGVPGYDAGQYYIALKMEGIKYNPDIVVFGFYFLNDINEINVGSNSGPKPIFSLGNNSLVLSSVPEESAAEAAAPKADYRVKNQTVYNMTKWLFDLKTLSLTKTLAKEYLYGFLSRLGLVKTVDDYSDKFAIFNEIIKKTKELLPGKTVAAILIPSRNIRFNLLERQIGEKMGSILKNNGIPFVDLTPTVIAGKDLYFPKDGHINEKGHQMASEAIAKLLGLSNK